MRKSDYTYVEVCLFLSDGRLKFVNIPNKYPYFFSKLATTIIGYLVMGKLCRVTFAYHYEEKKKVYKTKNNSLD